MRPKDTKVLVDKSRLEALERVAKAAEIWRNCLLDRAGLAKSREEAKENHIRNARAVVELAKAVDALEAVVSVP
jgi:hypothetical protein